MCGWEVELLRMMNGVRGMFSTDLNLAVLIVAAKEGGIATAMAMEVFPDTSSSVGVDFNHDVQARGAHNFRVHAQNRQARSSEETKVSTKIRYAPNLRRLKRTRVLDHSFGKRKQKRATQTKFCYAVSTVTATMQRSHY